MVRHTQYSDNGWGELVQHVGQRHAGLVRLHGTLTKCRVPPVCNHGNTISIPQYYSSSQQLIKRLNILR